MTLKLMRRDGHVVVFSWPTREDAYAHIWQCCQGGKLIEMSRSAGEMQ